MAELSDHDKENLLGKDYKAKLREQDVATGATDATRLAASKAAKLDNVLMTALGVGAIALLIFATNYFSMSTPYNSTLAIGSALVALASIGVAYFAKQSKAT
jgi:hypothetical protein